MDFKNFNWGDIPIENANFFENESKTAYNRVFDVEENDVVVDFGAFVGSFTYGILDKNPEHCWVLEPVKENFKILYKNLKNHQVSFTRAAISDQKEVVIDWFYTSVAKGITFKNFIENNCIEKIDFFKCDCEGGEYLIFTDDNLDYLKSNVKKMVIEFHLDDNFLKSKFQFFRDNILKNFNNFYVYSVDGLDIKNNLFDENFTQNYNAVLIHIDNRNNK